MEPQVVDNERRSRFETTVDGRVAELTYRRRGKRLVLIHTGVPEELEGRGIGSALVAAAVADARARNVKLVVQCQFAVEWLRRHPDAVHGLHVECDQRSEERGSDDGA